MAFPYYVNPEQMAQDKREFALKGVARGKSIVTLEYGGGILLLAENPFKLSKIGEIYDRIAFAGVGKFSEFDRLRKMGIQWADVEGYRFSRDDVRGKALANLYSQAIGEEFNRSMKPFEVEIVVAEVGDPQFAGHEANALYHVDFEGTIKEQTGFCVIGGGDDAVQSHMDSHFRAGLPLGEALRLGRDALQRAGNSSPELEPESLEACLLENERSGRKFRRLSADDVRGLLGV